ncbi:hypothetical protein NUU61_007826 [Penicillium alfredii]|uniref:Uncharacterized protein n=1 Tax=Penicillium alfredii TaxID=1506179 RepID=A0A9W9JYD6_9EURO|nr:uncharacterized protein NUU61_007826 [Penicillium alfredii]KAJ5086519.1 hypothetical protein NUU61_007826 [Penicillium alfredii]
MPSSRRSISTRPPWPPAPRVEDEVEALSRELHGMSKLGDKPGLEGTCARGTVDQHPVLVTAENSVASSSPPSVPSVPGLGNVSSDDSTGPATPPGSFHEPVFPTTSRSQSVHRPRSMSSSTSSKMHGRAQVHQQPSRQPSREPSARRDLRPPSSSSRESYLSRDGEPVQIAPHDSRGRAASERSWTQGSQGSQGPMYNQPSLYPPKAPLSRSNSARSRYGPSSAACSTASQNSSGPRSGYQSDLTTARSRPLSHGPPPSVSTVSTRVPETLPTRGSGSPPSVSTVSMRMPETLPPGPTLAERIEEKLRQRQERRESGSMSDAESRARAASVKPPSTVSGNSNRTSAPSLPSQEIYRATSQRSSYSRPRTASVPVPPGGSGIRSSSGTRQPLRPGSSDEVQTVLRRHTTPQSASDRSQAQSVQSSQPSTASSRPTSMSSAPQQASNPAGLCVSPCPRSVPVAGYQDWYTLRGLPHLDICPSCMNQVAHSRYRNFFIPSLVKPPNQKTRCAFANPWARLAWAQMIKKQHDSLEMLYQMTRPPPGARGCPGRIASEQNWYRIVDPDTGKYLPRFQVCGSCVRNVRILMPSHRETFEASPEPQARVCNFLTSSPRFVQYIDLLDAAASRADASSTRSRPDPRPFIAYARRKVVLRDCPRDKPVLTTWHYIPSLPELCVCEDCYDEVVWPLAKSRRPIARMFSTAMRLLPGDGPNNCREASCQLYSARMRARFRDTVDRDDFAALRSVTLRRFEAERRFRDRADELLDAEGRGYDCNEEMRKAIAEWRRWE